MSCPLGLKHVCCTRISGLSVKAGNTQILDNVNLHLHCRELTAVVGRNGAGKSTLLKALLDVVPHTGSIIFEGENKTPTNHPRFGYVPQSLSTEQGSPVNVGDLILSCLSRYPVWFHRRKSDKEMIQGVLASVHAEGLALRRVGDLSGGEIQRVMLALAIHPVPDILLLDEPVSGVDRTGLELFYQLVSSLRKNYDTTILLVSHDLDLVARHADRVVLIERGVAASGTVTEVYNSKPFIRTFGHIDTVIQDPPDGVQ
ncbi:MAG: metal ABC transporter ATP-binding protein [Treponema sp.]